MNYLLDRKIKRRRFIYFGLLLVLLATIFYFRSGIFKGFSYAAHMVFRPVLILGGSMGEKIKNTESFFASKNSLQDEINNLQSKLSEGEGRTSNYNSLLAENIFLKEILGRKNLGNVSKGSPCSNCLKTVLAAILSKPNLSPYDTLVIDIGGDDGVEIGNAVFALGNVPIGRISDAYPNTSKVILFSTGGEKTQVVIDKNIFFEIIGRGGGNFEMILPRDFTSAKGDEVAIPGIMPYVVAKVETIISDPREPFVKALLVSPVNIQDLKFVQVELK